jgi:hypothetical protein
VIYIAGPLTDPNPEQQRANVNTALLAYLELTSRGIGAICPHLAALDMRAFEVEYDAWIQQGLKQLGVCSGIWLLPRWHTSTGALTELLRARQRKIPVCYTLADVLLHFAPAETARSSYFHDEVEYSNRLPI